MKGHIRERSPGHWAIILDQRDPATGKRKRKWHSFEGTKREAQTECSRLVAAVSSGSYLEPRKTTLADFLGRWLDHIKSQVSPKTLERYSGLVNKNIIPAMGALQLSRLKPAQISDAYAKALSGPPGRKSWRSSSSHGGLYPSRVEAGFEPSSPLGRTRSQSADAVDPPNGTPCRPMTLHRPSSCLSLSATPRFLFPCC